MPTVAIEQPVDEDEEERPPVAVSLASASPEQLRPLAAVRSAFAQYINEVHRHLHPRFADRYLASRPPSASDAVVLVELALRGRDGRLVQARAHEPSGDDSFDRGALDVVRRADPFPVAPSSLWSFDGNVYLRWALHRDPETACTTLGAMPFLLGPPRHPKAPGDP